MKFYDTCSLLLAQEKVFEDDEIFGVSSVTLQEIESIKTSSNKDENIKFKARKLIKLLDKNYEKYKVFTPNIKLLDEFNLQVNNDNLIIITAFELSKEQDIIFYSDDICCKTIARQICGLNVISISDIELNKDDFYKGYIYHQFENDNDMAIFYENLNENTLNLLINQYAILKSSSGEIVDKIKWNGEMNVSINPRNFKSNMFGTVKPLDDIQACAFDSIQNNDITVLIGKAGCGKTTLPLSYICQMLETQKYKKCYIVYHFETLKGAKQLGFVKGDTQTKILETGSLGNILSSKFGDRQQVERMLASGTLEIIPTANIRGTQFNSDDMLFLTEAQDVDTYTLKTIVQRCEDGCKILLEGDILEQSDLNTSDLGLPKMIDVFKNYEKFGCIKLKNNYRSPICELADKM